MFVLLFVVCQGLGRGCFFCRLFVDEQAAQQHKKTQDFTRRGLAPSRNPPTKNSKQKAKANKGRTAQVQLVGVEVLVRPARLLSPGVKDVEERGAVALAERPELFDVEATVGVGARHLRRELGVCVFVQGVCVCAVCVCVHGACVCVWRGSVLSCCLFAGAARRPKRRGSSAGKKQLRRERTGPRRRGRDGAELAKRTGLPGRSKTGGGVMTSQRFTPAALPALTIASTLAAKRAGGV